jgi:hypothetical protein
MPWCTASTLNIRRAASQGRALCCEHGRSLVPQPLASPQLPGRARWEIAVVPLTALADAEESPSLLSARVRSRSHFPTATEPTRIRDIGRLAGQSWSSLCVSSMSGRGRRRPQRSPPPRSLHLSTRAPRFSCGAATRRPRVVRRNEFHAVPDRTSCRRCWHDVTSLPPSAHDRACGTAVRHAGRSAERRRVRLLIPRILHAAIRCRLEASRVCSGTPALLLLHLPRTVPIALWRP